MATVVSLPHRGQTAAPNDAAPTRVLNPLHDCGFVVRDAAGSRSATLRSLLAPSPGPGLNPITPSRSRQPGPALRDCRTWAAPISPLAGAQVRRTSRAYPATWSDALTTTTKIILCGSACAPVLADSVEHAVPAIVSPSGAADLTGRSGWVDASTGPTVAAGALLPNIRILPAKDGPAMANTLDPIERFILEDLPQMQKLALTAALVDQTINEQERALHDFMADFADRLAEYYGRRVLGRDIERNGFTRQTLDHAKACGVQLTLIEREPARIIKFPTHRTKEAG